MSREPFADIPEMPPGYMGEKAPTPIAWAVVERRLAESTHYWLSTMRPDGRPHVVPRWGVWLDQAFWYDGSPETRHARNLEQNPYCALHLESGKEVTIVEGRSLQSQPIQGPLGERLSAEYGRKYGPAYTPGPDAWSGAESGGLRVLTPVKAIAWSVFPKDLSRFTFPDET